MNKIIGLVVVGMFLILSACTGKYEHGKRIYTAKCASCHMEDGTGLRGVIPPLANSDFLQQNQSSLVCIVKNGMNGPVVVNGKSYDNAMNPIDINDVQLTNVINYINTAWGNDFPEVSLKDVQDQAKKCAE